MDRSTQVNFPIVSDQRRQLRGHHTSSFIALPESIAITKNIWQQPPMMNRHFNKPRPKSMNLHSEVYQKNRVSYASDYFSPTSSDIALDLEGYYKEKLPSSPPPFSSNSSLVFSSFGYNKNAYQKQSNGVRKNYSLQDLQEPASLKCGCRCWDIENKSTVESISGATPTPEGLSWRRLHMSRAKLKATATTSELLSGFAMVAMVELQINEDTLVPEWLFIMFAICTTILVAVHIFALMISTYILPNIDAIAKLDVCEIVNESPHERMRGFIELAWVFSTVLGLFLFLVEVSILCWVKFWDTSFMAAIAATVIVIPVLIIFVLFAVHFYHSLVIHRYDTSINSMEKLEDMKKHLDEATSPV